MCWLKIFFLQVFRAFAKRKSVDLITKEKKWKLLIHLESAGGKVQPVGNRKALISHIKKVTKCVNDAMTHDACKPAANTGTEKVTTALSSYG